MRWCWRSAVSALVVLAVSSCAESDPVNPWHPDLGGAIEITVEPDYLQAPWSLEGPDGFRRTGAGTTSIANAPSGQYRMTWETMTGWDVPSPSVQALGARSVLRFDETFTPLAPGSLTIAVSPDTIDPPWTLTGPHGYAHSGSGSVVLEDLALGTYTLNWGSLAGWTVTGTTAVTRTLSPSERITVAATFVESHSTATLRVRPLPETVVAPWIAAGPNGYASSGSGATTIGGLTPGDYTVTWRAVDGWTAPDPTTVSLTAGATVVAEGTYSESSGSTYLALVAGPDLDTTTGTWNHQNQCSVHVVLCDVPASGVRQWELAVEIDGSNAILQGADFLGGDRVGTSTNAIVSYDTARLPDEYGRVHVATFTLYNGSRAQTTIQAEPVAMIGHNPSTLLFRDGNDPTTDRVLHERDGNAVFTVDP